MGDILPFERPDPVERNGGAAPDDHPRVPEGEVVAMSDHLERKVRRLLDQQRAYTERAERAVEAVRALERQALDLQERDEDDGALDRAVVALVAQEQERDALLAAIRAVSDEARASIDRLQHIEDQRRRARGESAA